MSSNAYYARQMDDRREQLGRFLRESREAKALSLREVEKQTGVSNAYVSQLEGGKVAQPSPTILHKLCRLYETSYTEAFTLAGYPTPDGEVERSNNAAARRLGRITEQEADQLSDYLAFLRAQARKK